MYNNFDLLGNMKTPNVYLCHTDKEFIGRIVVKNLSPVEKWNTYNEISFDIPFKLVDIITGEIFINPYYDKVESLRNIYVEEIGFFQIQNIELELDGIKEYKSITAHSYEVVLGQKYLNNFKINTGETDSLEYEENPNDITPIRIYYPGKKSHSLLDIILEKIPNWFIGHVDSEFTMMNRMFDIDRMSIYDFLMGEVAPTVHGVFIFDTIQNTINLYAEEKAGQDTDIFISKDNLLKEANVKYDSNDIKTSLKVSGDSEEVNIRIHNFGSDYITDLSYYTTPEYMGDELYRAYTSYLNSLPDKQKRYTTLANQYNTLENELIVLKTELVDLQGQEQSYTNIQQVQLESGWADKDKNTNEYIQYQKNFEKLNNVKRQIISKQSYISAKERAINNKLLQMTNVTNEIKYENNFTQAQLVKLNLFIMEDEYSDHCFSFTDNDSSADKLETETELYEAAKKELAKISQPQLSFSMSMANIYALKIYEQLSQYFRVGNYMTVWIRDNYYVHARIVEISFNYDDPTDFSVEFGNVYRSKSVVDIHSELLRQTNNLSNKVANSNSFWQKSSKVANDTMQILKDGLGEALKQIKMSDNQDVTYDRYGLHLRKKADENAVSSDLTVDGYYKKQAWITNDKFMYTSDGWETAKSAFGTFNYNGQEVYGLMADMVIAGLIQGSQITGSNITGTKINNGNKTFYVTADGALTATSADIKGKITATSGSFSGWNIWDESIYTDYDSDDGYTYRVYIQKYVKRHGLNSWIYSTQRKITGSSDNFQSIMYIRGDGKMAMTSRAYPQIFGHAGVLQLAASDNGAEGIVLQPYNVLRPAGTGAQGSLGTSTHKWATAYIVNAAVSSDLSVSGTLSAETSAITSSDLRIKKDIEQICKTESENFIYSLNPISYRLKNGKSGRKHHGFVAQEVKESMGNYDWGVYCEIKTSDELTGKENNTNNDTDNDVISSLRYEELIADIVSVLQAQNQRIKVLEENKE